MKTDGRNGTYAPWTYAPDLCTGQNAELTNQDLCTIRTDQMGLMHRWTKELTI